ncbi:MAG: hypothetical protein Q8R28_11280 [Dehalococcoidia bacterium]|nr:hypothetical protein [Dehalococcoidia bacterium]
MKITNVLGVGVLAFLVYQLFKGKGADGGGGSGDGMDQVKLGASVGSVTAGQNAKFGQGFAGMGAPVAKVVGDTVKITINWTASTKRGLGLIPWDYWVYLAPVLSGVVKPYIRIPALSKLGTQTDSFSFVLDAAEFPPGSYDIFYAIYARENPDNPADGDPPPPMWPFAVAPERKLVQTWTPGFTLTAPVPVELVKLGASVGSVTAAQRTYVRGHFRGAQGSPFSSILAGRR